MKRSTYLFAVTVVLVILGVMLMRTGDPLGFMVSLLFFGGALVTGCRGYRAADDW